MFAISLSMPSPHLFTTMMTSLSSWTKTFALTSDKILVSPPSLLLSQIRYSLVVILELNGGLEVQYKSMMTDRWWKVSTEIIDVVKSEV